METIAEKKLYEGMFLVDSSKAASDWDGVIAAINKVLDRADAEIVSMRKWDDRRLAYDIRRTSRGTYMLCYFKAEGRKIQGIEKDVQLSENIIRVLILSTEQMTQEDIEKDTPATKSEKEKAAAEQKLQAAAAEQGDKPEEPAAEQVVETEQAGETEQVMETEQAVETEQVMETEQAVETEQVMETEQAEETDKPEETRKAEDAGQTEEVQGEEPQDPEPKVSSDD